MADNHVKIVYVRVGYMSAEAFNLRYPVGSEFVYYPYRLANGDLAGTPRHVQTKCKAWTLGTTPVVQFNDGRGGYAISHLMAKRELPDPGV